MVSSSCTVVEVPIGSLEVLPPIKERVGDPAATVSINVGSPALFFAHAYGEREGGGERKRPVGGSRRKKAVDAVVPRAVFVPSCTSICCAVWGEVCATLYVGPRFLLAPMHT